MGAPSLQLILLALWFTTCPILGLYIPEVKNTLSRSCTKCHDLDPDKINVHLIHHSHDDVGWLKTVDQYYWGLNNSIAHVGVQYIMSSVANALDGFPDRRFIQVETAFFWMWWENQDEVIKAKFRKLVENGQIELVNGAWSMNDEACVNYQATINQFTWGFKILTDTLGTCGQPTIAWQIDPFGHTREHGSLMLKMGFDGIFFGRLDHNDRKIRKAQKDMDFLWKPSANSAGVIYAGAFGSERTYHTPDGFCFDLLCNDDAINDNPNDGGYNLDSKIDSFAETVKSYANYYKTNNVIITMGGDFYHQAADINYENSDRLIKAFQNNSDIKIVYSTPSCYLQAVYDAQPEMSLTSDDFLPYSNDDDTFWVGYFTSRPSLKLFERVSHNILQVANQLNSLTQSEGLTNTKLKQASGVVQHHDAITGTEKQHVTNDYLKMLAAGVNEAEQPFTKLIGQLLETDLPELSSCLLANMSICTVSQTSEQFVVVVYNPLAWSVDHVVKIPVQEGFYSVTGPNGEVKSDVVDPISTFSYAKIDGVDPAKSELVFVANQIPPLGIQSYLVMKISSVVKKSDKLQSNDVFKFGDETVGFELDETTNLLKSVTINGKTLEISQNFGYYISKDGSGAYIFKPSDTAQMIEKATIVRTYLGDVVEEVQQNFNDWITQIIRVYKGTFNYVEFDWMVGPIDTSDDKGKEVISRFQVKHFQNEKTFYTDSNGREMIQRVLNYRPTFDYDVTKEPISSNYYPITSKITIIDEKQKLRVSVLNDRSQGGTSLDEGQIELMVHRRILKDDGKGVGEALNEEEFGQGLVARGQHYLILGSTELTNDEVSVTAQERILAQEKLLQPWIGLGDTAEISETDLQQLIEKTYSALNPEMSIPPNVNILTLESRNNFTYILRLEHFLEESEDLNLSEAVTIDLTELFADFTVEDVVETTLSANRQLEDSLYDWSYTGLATTSRSYESLKVDEVELQPMDIRTFIVTLKEKN